MNRIAILIVLAIIASGCQNDRPTANVDPEVFVSIEPLVWFVQQIGGPTLYAESLIKPGQDPHTFQPTPKQIVQLGKAKLFLCTGLPIERRIAEKLAGASSPPRIADVSEGIERKPMAAHGHDHPDEHHDEEAELDPHIWMSPRLAIQIAERVCEELSRLHPDKADLYRKNLAKVQADLQALDAKLAEALAPVKGRTFFVFHPAFGYFADNYGLTQQAVETGGRTPGPRHMQNLVDQARRQGVRVIFVQKQFSTETARSIAEQIDGTVVSLDPLARDYLRNLEDVADRIKRSLTPAAP